MVSVVAMLYLVLFATLAVGFYTQITVSAQAAANQRRELVAQLAADAGLDFMRFHLSGLQVPHLVDPKKRMEEVRQQILDRLDGTINLGAYSVEVDPVTNVISVPNGANNYIQTSPDGRGFRALLRLDGDDLVCQVVGRSNPTAAPSKYVQVVFKTEERTAPLFDYGVAARGQVEVTGGGTIRGGTNAVYGSVFTSSTVAPQLYMTGPSTITGDAYFTVASPTISVETNSKIGNVTGTLNQAPHIHSNRPTPEFPTIDTATLIAYATNPYVSGSSTLRNIKIPKNSGSAKKPLTIASGTTVEGVCYIEAPNCVQFAGSVTIKGVIVSANGTPTDTTNNVIEFAGQATALDISTVTDLPAELRAMGGSSIVAPGFNVKFSGGYASMSGSIASAQLTFSGNAGGNITGNVLGLDNQKLVVTGSGTVQIEKPTTSKWPAGMYFRHRYVPSKQSYLELKQTDVWTTGGALPPVLK